MSQPNRIWCEQDFSQLYEQEPKIINCSTYITLHLIIETDTILVKIPSTASEEIYRFLLYKAIYHYYLDHKHPNPLFKTAQISCFESTASYTLWYKLWCRGTLIPKNNSIHYESIIKYIPLAMIQANQECNKILARSRRQGKYYKICAYQHAKTKSDYLNYLYLKYKLLQHPFLTHLGEAHKTTTHTYFAFQHSPFTFKDIIQSEGKLSKQQVYIYFMEVLMGLIFLQQHHLLIGGIEFDMIDVGFDGHLVLNEEVLSKYQDNNSTERSKSNILFLFELFNTLVSKSSVMGNGNRADEQIYVMFGRYLIELADKRRVSIKQILNHPWIQQTNAQNILTKSTAGFDVKQITKENEYRQLNHGQIEAFYRSYCQNSNSTDNFYQSYEIHHQTNQQMVYKRYCSLQQRRQNRENERNPTSHRRILKTNSSTSKLSQREQCKPLLSSVHQVEAQNSHMKKSPYYSILKKQGFIKPKKPLRS